MWSHAYVCVRGERVRGNLQWGDRCRDDAPPQVQHHPDDTGHTTQQSMIDAWWHSSIRARAFTSHAWDNCGLLSALFIAKRALFPFSFLSKKKRENKKDGLPSLPGGGWGGDGRVHAPGASLDLYPAGFHCFSFYVFYY